MFTTLEMSQESHNEEETGFHTNEEQPLSLEESIQLCSQLLTDLIQNQGNQCQSVFDCKEIPKITIEMYIKRIQKYTRFSPQCLIIAIIFIDRYNIEVEEFSINWHNVHRLLLTTLMLAVKFQDDVYFDNCTFEKAGGVCASQLLIFELQVFEKLGFNAFVQEQQYLGLLERLRSVYHE